MKSMYQRKFNVDYFEVDANTWKIVSHLEDDAHDIVVETELSVPEMIIKEAVISFKRCPLEECSAIERKASMLKGIDIRKDYREKVIKIFIGPEGCPNIMSLLGISVPGFMYTYYPHLVKTGRMNVEDLKDFFVTKFPDDCLAHRLFSAKKSGG